MNFFRRMTQWIQHSDNITSPSTSVIVNDKVEQARRAQYAEQYDDALALLIEAMNLAEEQGNTTIKVDITLSHADILIAREDYEAAKAILNELRDESELRQHRAPLAYALASLGTIEQKQGHFDAASDLYEESRRIAELIQTDGANGRATAHLADIYLLDGNASYAIYLLRDAIPRLIRSGDKELLGYFQARLGEALIAIGQPQEGMAVMQQGLEAAFVLKHQAQVRDISQKLGYHALQLADYDKAIQYLRDALRLYDKTTHSSDIVVLLCQLSHAFYSMGKSHESLDYAKQANELIDSITDTSVIAMAKAALGLSLSAVGKNDEALAYLQAAE
ncbi:MAG: hypothetical protein Q9P44_13275 [Anaerolineae bacterium]|nr:hypothetical protein [Anaerolineae bacterium]